MYSLEWTSVRISATGRSIDVVYVARLRGAYGYPFGEWRNKWYVIMSYCKIFVIGILIRFLSARNPAITPWLLSTPLHHLATLLVHWGHTCSSALLRTAALPLYFADGAVRARGLPGREVLGLAEPLGPGGGPSASRIQMYRYMY